MFFCIFAETEVATNLLEFYLHELSKTVRALLWIMLGITLISASLWPRKYQFSTCCQKGFELFVAVCSGRFNITSAVGGESVQSRLVRTKSRTKMPVGCRITDLHLNYLASRAKEEPRLSGKLLVKDSDHSTPKWQKRWIALYQNFLFYFENSSCSKPAGMVFLEHSIVDVLSLTRLRDLSNQVMISYVGSSNSARNCRPFAKLYNLSYFAWLCKFERRLS